MAWVRKKPSRPLRVVAVQHAAGSDVAANLAALAGRLPAPGMADLAVLPELFACRGAREALRASAEPIGGPLTQWLADAAVRHNCWMLGGSLVERDGARLYNTALLVDRRGRLRTTYRKIHLFQAKLSDGTVVRERAWCQAGERPCLASIEDWTCGLSICFDLRFPELYRHYASQGARLLLIPADFTDETGRAHWEVLVRARAIENQCFVIAPCQCGRNPHTGVKSHGHSLIVDPWGQILARGGVSPERLSATLDPARCAEIRSRLPVLRQRRISG
jgi:deaminated glutathione amidase